MEYKKQTIIELQRVASEALNHNEQAYKIVYYYKTDKFIDKITVYFIGVPIQPKKIICSCEKEHIIKSEEIRSIYFLAPEQFLFFIQNSIHSYFCFKEKRLPSNMLKPISELRLIMLDDFIKDLRNKQLERWKKKNTNNY